MHSNGYSSIHVYTVLLYRCTVQYYRNYLENVARQTPFIEMALSIRRTEYLEA